MKLARASIVVSLFSALGFGAGCQPTAEGTPPAPVRGTGGALPATGGSPVSGSGGSVATGGAGPTSTGGSSAGTGGTESVDTAPGTGGAAPAEVAPEVSADTGPGPGWSPQRSCPAGPFEAPKVGARASICPGFDLKYNWSEGPTWIASQQAFFFSNFQVGQAGPGDIIKYTPATNKCEIWIENCGCNGLGAAIDGNLLAACHTPRQLLKYDVVTKAKTVIVDKVEGKQLDSPNDVIAHSNGTIFFTNPVYELAGRPRGLGLALVRVDPMGNTSVLARGMLNGIGLSPDEKKLYVTFLGNFDLDDNAMVVKRGGGPGTGGDGFAIDCAGNIYTDRGTILSPDGRNLGNFPSGTNLTFGGPDGKTILAVGRRNMHTVQMNIPGIP